MTNDQIQIVQATINDLEEIVPIFEQYRVFYNREPDADGARQFLFDKFEHRESVIFAARDVRTNQFVGFTQLYPTFSSLSMMRVWVLNDLFVNEQYRKMGIATKLMNRAKEFAILTKAKGIELETSIHNETAQRLYESLGYKRNDGGYHYFLFL